MTESLQRATVIRKIQYIACILILFTISLFWRGKVRMPFGNPREASAIFSQGQTPALADQIASWPIAQQAERLELHELDLGDAEVAGSVANVSLIGIRGFIVTIMWHNAIQAQKRAEYDEFELYARAVTRLQPHFVEPWIFQAWNISYNVSVENEKLGDAYFYIARGIELLSEGDRLNTREYRGQGDSVPVGSPHIRYNIAHFYMNKFFISDKVQTLRCLMQLSCMKPSERDPDRYLDERAIDNDRINLDRFRSFCERNPQLVRRLNLSLKCERPRDVIDFLRINRSVPTRYLDDRTANCDVLKADKDQFPALPPAFTTDNEHAEYNPRSETTDTFDAMHAARAWYEYAQMVTPPPVEGRPSLTPRPARPGRKPELGEYDQYRYRLPPRPSLIIFRQQPCRAQTYVAERLQKEGWFDANTTWLPSEPAEWFGKDNPLPRLSAKINSQEEWDRSYRMWYNFGRRNGFLLDVDQERYEEMVRLAKRTVNTVLGGPYDAIPSPPSSRTKEDIEKYFGMTMDEYNALKRAPDYRDDELAKIGVTRAEFDARLQLGTLALNRRITNFFFFLHQTEAEKSPGMIRARILIAESEALKNQGDFLSAIPTYARGIAEYRKVMLQFPKYHYMENLETTQEQMAEQELNLTKILLSDAQVLAKAEAATTAFRSLVPAAPSTVLDDWRNVIADQEALTLIALEMPNPAVDARVEQQTAAVLGTGLTRILLADPSSAEFKKAIRRSIIEKEFPWMRENSSTADGRSPDRKWVGSVARDKAKEKAGLIRKSPEPTADPMMEPRNP